MTRRAAKAVLFRERKGRRWAAFSGRYPAPAEALPGITARRMCPSIAGERHARTDTDPGQRLDQAVSGRIRAVAVGLMALLAGPASACSPVIRIWTEGVPLPAIVIEGQVVSESSRGVWDRSIVVSPVKVIRGQWEGEIRAAVSCGASSPAVGELALLARMKNEDEWVLIPAWQQAEFARFLREGS